MFLLQFVKLAVERTVAESSGPMSTKGIRATIKRFEETGKLRVQPGRGRKHVTLVLLDGVKTAVDAQSQTLELGGNSVRAVSRVIGFS
ncbi:hypothetical protein TNCT_523931 [Trichonephila clavata]|uniref:DUF4817 domain-containing protein n=1 Tax=Trichonephila clavata TaxID=2740835 RepID=A0A8X6GRC4_TRICU|nr:hypothetical protein TNCT_523931 [Trichonephila clavata]